MAVPLSRQQQQQLHQQQEAYFSSGLATPPPPQLIGQSPMGATSPYFLSSTGGGAIGNTSDLPHTPSRYYNSHLSALSGASGYSPTFLSPAAAATAYPGGLGPHIRQQPRHEASLSGMQAQMNGYWPATGSSNPTTPSFNAGNPGPANASLHYEDYFLPGSHTHSPSGSYSMGRKSDGGFEPMNTSPTVQQQQQHSSPWQQWHHSPSPSRGFGISPGHTGQPAQNPIGYPSGGGTPLHMASPPPQPHYFSFFGNEPETPPPVPPLMRSTSLKDITTSGVGAGDVAAAAAAFHRSKQLFETPPKGGVGAGSATVTLKSGPPVFGLGGNYDLEEGGPRILQQSSSSPNLHLDKRRSGSGDGSGGKKSRQFGPSPSGSMASLIASASKSSSSVPVSPSSSGSSVANSPTLTPWVTVFGFSAAATSYVISHFGQFGTVLETKCVPGSNWVHIKYSNKFEARKALNKNGAVIGGNMMVGIMPYDPEAVGDDGGAPPPITSTPTARVSASAPAFSTSTPKTTSVQIQPVTGGGASSAGGVGPSSSSGSVQIQAARKEVNARLRPLVHTGYLGTNPLPKENNGIVSRALEFLFGW